MRRGGPLKRTGSLKRTPLARNAPPRSTSRPVQPVEQPGKALARAGQAPRQTAARRRPLEPGEAAWKRKRYGRCAVCGTYGRVIRHHLLIEQEIRREATAEQLAAGAAWDPRNALAVGAPMPLGGRCTCHADHHSAKRRIPYARIPAEAKEFAVEILGHAKAYAWYQRYYSTEGGGT